MDSGRVFVSYSRRDQEVVTALVRQLDALGLEVWLDQELSGGQPWWDSILEKIRTCTCFVFGLSASSVNSRACRAELDYAYALGRPILPVVSGPAVPDQLLPPVLAETQRIDPGNPTQLARALLSMPEPPPLPDPLPAPPPVPISYMVELADLINREHLTVSEQRDLAATLKHQLRDEEERPATIELMERLRRHPDINAWIAEDLDAELLKQKAPARDTAPAPPPATAAPPRAAYPPPAPGHRPPDPTYPPPVPAPRPPPVQHWAPPQPPRPVAPVPPKRSNAGWIFAVIAVVLLVGVGGCIALSFADFGDPGTDLTTLRNGCAQGDMSDCDDLFRESPLASDDELFGSTCGGRSDPLAGGCVAFFGEFAG